MLSRLSVKNFRLLRDVTLDVEPGKPIVLVGPNGSGKSSVIQVLDLLGRAAQGGLRQALMAFGGPWAIFPASAPASEMVVGVVTDVPAASSAQTVLGYALDYSMRLQGFTVGGEALHARFSDGAVSTLSRDGKNLSASDGQNRVSESLGDAASDKLTFELQEPIMPGPLHAMKGTLSTIRVYDGFLTTPPWARDVSEVHVSPFESTGFAPCPRIDRRGLDLINALHDLQSNHSDEWDDLERAFKAEFPFVEGFDLAADPAGGRISLGLRDRRHPGVSMLGRDMSEGMAAYLCLLAAILTPDPAVAIAFDEPDRHLHPSALGRVVHLLEKLSERTAVFVATHSDRLLDHLSDPAGSVRVCEPTEEGVSIRALDRDALDAWRADFTISELRRRGHIDPENASAAEP